MKHIADVSGLGQALVKLNPTDQKANRMLFSFPFFAIVVADVDVVIVIIAIGYHGSRKWKSS